MQLLRIRLIAAQAGARILSYLFCIDDDIDQAGETEDEPGDGAERHAGVDWQLTDLLRDNDGVRVGWADREADQRADGDNAQRGHDIIADSEAQRNHERDEGDWRVYGTGQAAPDEEERVENDQHDHAAFCTDLADERAEHSLQRARGCQNAHAGDAHIDQNDDVRHGDEALRDRDKHIKQVDRRLIDPVIGAGDDHFDVIYGFAVKLTGGDDVGQHGCQQDYDQENDIDMRDGVLLFGQ